MYVINSHRKKELINEEIFNELTINTELGSSASDTFILPLYLIDFIRVDWGDGTIEDFSTTGNKTHVYSTPGIYTVKMYGKGNQMFRFIDIDSGDRQKVTSGVIGNTGWTSFNSTFFDCGSLTTLDVSGWDVGSVNTFASAFYGCSSLTTLDVSEWDVSAVTYFGNAFSYCSSLIALDASAWVMSPNLQPASYNQTFRSCGTLDLKIGPGWNFSALPGSYNGAQFLMGTDIGSTNYDNMLSIIASQPLNNGIIFGGGNSKYTAAGKVHRDAIIANNSWIFADGGLEA